MFLKLSEKLPLLGVCTYQGLRKHKFVLLDSSCRFKYLELTKIHDCPNHKSLKTIKNEMKTNAAVVSSSLAGGTHGLFGLVLTPVENAVVVTVPF